jgi:alpha-tubulin suppressor-like RCC1 family protein
VTSLNHAVVAISVGLNHTCALLANGTAWCWGSNIDGALGNGQQGFGIQSEVPIQVASLGNNVAQISAGGEFTCALLRTGAVECWGANFIGQVGSGTFNDQPGDPIGIPTPTPVVGLGSGVIQISAGGFHACAISVGGSLSCWGADTIGQLGDGKTTVSRSAVPVSVLSLGGTARQVTAGSDHTCAVLVNGSLRCWGDNTQGDLGNGNDTFSPLPVSVVNLSNVSAASAGFAHTCALSRGELSCWGDLQNSTIYNGLTAIPPFSFLPVRVKGGRTLAVSVGEAHTCLLRENGKVQCWGANMFGELGVGDTTDRPKPTRVHIPCP